MKHNSVLIVCLNSSIGGVSTRMEGEVNAFIDRGVDVYILGDERVKECSYATNPRVKQVKIADLGECNTVDNIITALDHVESLILENNISFIYSHHPDMYFISAIASQRLKIPFMITLHGIGFHLFNNPFQHFILRNFVYPYASLVTCMSPALTTISRIYAPDTNLRLYHNLVNTERFNPAHADSTDSIDERWLIVSRIDAEKFPGLVKFIEYAYRAGVPGVVIAGDGGLVDKLKQLISEAGIIDYVTFLGARKDIHELVHRYSAVAGVDRVVLEAGSSMKPVCVLGYNGGIKGFLKPDNFKRLAYTNFCGRDLPDLDLNDFIAEVNEVESIDLTKIRSMIEEDYSEVDKWPQNVGEYLTYLEFKENKDIQVLYDLMCFYNKPIEGQIYTSAVFKKYIVKDILLHNDRDLTAEYQEFLGWLENSGSFVKPHSYAIRDSKIKIADSVNEGEIVFASDEGVYLNDGVLIELEDYLKANYGHKMKIKIRAMTHDKDHETNPMIMTVAFKASDQHKDAKHRKVEGLSLSENEKIGHFKYVPLKNFMWEFSFDLLIKDSSEVEKIMFTKWQAKEYEEIFIEKIEVQVLN